MESVRHAPPPSIVVLALMSFVPFPAARAAAQEAPAAAQGSPAVGGAAGLGAPRPTPLAPESFPATEPAPAGSPPTTVPASPGSSDATVPAPPGIPVASVPAPPGSSPATAPAPAGSPAVLVLQTVPPPPPPSGYLLTAPGQLAPVSGPTQRSRSGPGVSAGRVGGEVIGYLAGMTASGAAALLVAFAGAAASCTGTASGDFCALAGIGLGAVVGGISSLVLAPLGVRIAGDLGGGDGGLGWTVLGYLAGTLGGALIAGGFAATNDDVLTATGGMLFFVGQAAGTILGYEVSSDDNHAPANPPSPVTTALRIAPTVAVAADGQGAVLGARGTF